jgi:hypothetical protein
MNLTPSWINLFALAIPSGGEDLSSWTFSSILYFWPLMVTPPIWLSKSWVGLAASYSALSPGAIGPVMEVTTPIFKIWGWAGAGLEDGGGGAGATEDVGGGTGAAVDDEGGGAGTWEVVVGGAVVVALGAQAPNRGNETSARIKKIIPIRTWILFIWPSLRNDSTLS